MREKTWTDEFGGKMTVRSGAAGYDFDVTDNEGRVFTLSFGYDATIAAELSYMFAARDGKIPDVTVQDMEFNAVVARRMWLAHEVGHTVGLDNLADSVVGWFRLAQNDQRYAMVLAALMGAADDLLD